MAEAWLNIPILDENNPNATSASTNKTEIPGGINGYIPSKYMAMLGGAFLGTLLISGLLFWLYRRRAKRKQREAGNVNVSISRPK